MPKAMLSPRAWSVALAAVLTVAGADAAQVTARWYKGNLHTHTLVSHGRALPVEAAVLYRDAGYHFLMFSDHNRTLTADEIATNWDVDNGRFFGGTPKFEVSEAQDVSIPGFRIIIR